jgi:hypothetical protein
MPASEGSYSKQKERMRWGSPATPETYSLPPRDGDTNSWLSHRQRPSSIAPREGRKEKKKRKKKKKMMMTMKISEG